MGKDKAYNKAKKKTWMVDNYRTKRALWNLLTKLKVIDQTLKYRVISYDHWSW